MNQNVQWGFSVAPGGSGGAGGAGGAGQMGSHVNEDNRHTTTWVTAPSYSVTGGTTTQAISFESDSGFAWAYKETMSLGKRSVKRIGPKLYFSYVKSKLNKTQNKKLKSRLTKLQSLVKNAHETGQKALYEEFLRMLMVAVKESEIAACGHDVYVNEADIDKFRHIVTENDQSSKNPIFFKKLEEFPRPIPAKISKVVKATQKRGLFDELWVLYLDYTGEQVKSTKEKIREKDPILFGRLKYDPKKFYFIVDWIDEHCDLALSKFVDQLRENDEEYRASEIGDITPEYLERIKTEVKEREDRLKTTNPGNFRDKMSEEDRASERAKWRQEAHEEMKALMEAQSKESAAVKKPWWKRIFKGFDGSVGKRYDSSRKNAR
jgi:hypothetical protein